jgi:hypothetical protein
MNAILNTISQNKIEAIAEHAIDQLRDGVGEGEYICDLHNELYNMDYFIIGTWQAKEWLGDEGFDCIELIREYEENNFGECLTDLSDAEKVVNMTAYIIGEQLLGECFSISGMNCDISHLRLNDSWAKILISELEAM